jgi:hypothetical protein
MRARTLILSSVILGFAFRLGFVSVMFLSAGEVESDWLMWALLIIMSVSLTRGIYRGYRVLRVALAVSKPD